MPANPPYVGRFAPSPSGALHFGSLLSAVASYLDAKANQGRWLVRIDNIDPPREQANAATNILKSLESFGLHWDGPVIYQSDRFPGYIETCIQLIENDLLYPCYCSRKKLASKEQYPGYCRKALSAEEKKGLITSLSETARRVFNTDAPHSLKTSLKDYSLRIRTTEFPLSSLNFDDHIQGKQKTPKTFGDFIVLRKDSLPSYMLACGLDDLQNNISHIVRGSDLLEASFWQRYLQSQCLHINQQTRASDLSYTHLPLVVNELQQKLSKQHHAQEIDINKKSPLLYAALLALGQKPDPKLEKESPEIILQWAIENWQISIIPAQNIALASLNI